MCEWDSEGEASVRVLSCPMDDESVLTLVEANYNTCEQTIR